MEHTKEPWDFSVRAENMVEIHTQDKSIASVALWSHGRPGSTTEDKANARRIVACVNGCKGINPEAVKGLLEALKSMLSIHSKDGCAGTECLCNKAQQAITKAEK